MKWKVLVSAPYFLPVIREYGERLAEEGIELVAADVRERLEEEELLPLVADIDGAICGDDRFTDRVMAAAPKLKVISKWGTGIDSIDSEAAARRCIKVCRTPNAFSEPVGDTVLGYVLSFARKFREMDAAIRGGEWRKPPLVALNERVLGVIGVGDCGKAVVRRAIGFGMRVLGTDIRDISGDFIEETGIEMVSLEVLLAESDFISLNCDLNPTSYHLMNDDTFALVKPGAYVINTGRGPTVEEAALVKALENGGVAGAALDVFEDEPLPRSSRLREFTDCYFAPHNANSSPGAWRRVHESTVSQLVEALKAVR